MELQDFLNFLNREFDFDTTGICEDTTFEEIGFDELDMIDLVMSAEDEFLMEIPDEALEKIETIGDFIDYINKKSES